jgi:hypothetical protein
LETGKVAAGLVSSIVETPAFVVEGAKGGGDDINGCGLALTAAAAEGGVVDGVACTFVGGECTCG